MGDRANVAIKQTTKDEDGNPTYVYLYTHWAGSRLPFVVQAALTRGQGRWGDDAYLTRIIFSEMIQGALLEDTGYGISTSIQDNSHEIIFIDDENQTISIGEKEWKYTDYISESLEDLKAIITQIEY